MVNSHSWFDIYEKYTKYYEAKIYKKHYFQDKFMVYAVFLELNFIVGFYMHECRVYWRRKVLNVKMAEMAEMVAGELGPLILASKYKIEHLHHTEILLSITGLFKNLQYLMSFGWNIQTRFTPGTIFSLKKWK